MRRSRSVWVLLVAAACADAAESEDASTPTEVETDTDTDADASTEGGDDPEVGEPGPLEERDCPEDSVLTADNFGMPFMLTWCAGCHSAQLGAGERANAPVGIDFDTLDGVRANLDRAYVRTAQAGASMPPAAGPTLASRQQLADWLACGAPE